MADHVPATALMIDLRGFTGRLQRFLAGDSQVDLPKLISTFSTEVVSVCHDVHVGDAAPWLHLNSTGDGALAVFVKRDDEPANHHALRAYLAGLRMMDELPGLLEGLGIVGSHPGDYQFGIGIESGHVVYAGFQLDTPGQPGLDTWLGHCINVAARLEALNKTYAGTCLMVGEEFVRQVAPTVAGVDYAALTAAHTGPESDIKRQTRIQLNDANETLLTDYVGKINLNGCIEQVLSYRVSPTLFEEGGREVMRRCEQVLGLDAPTATEAAD